MEKNKKIENKNDQREEVVDNLVVTKEAQRYSKYAKWILAGSIITSIIIAVSPFGKKNNKQATTTDPTPTVVTQEADAYSMTLTADEIKSLAQTAYNNNTVIINNAGYNQADVEDVVSLINNNIPLENDSARIEEPADAEVFLNDLATDTINSRLELMGVYETTGESGLRLFRYQDVVHSEVNSFFTELDQDYRNVLDGSMNRDEFLAKYYKVAIGEDEKQFLFSQDAPAGIELSFYYAISQAYTDILMQDPNASIPANLVYKDAQEGSVIRVDTMFGYITTNELGETAPYVSENGEYPMEYASTLEAIRRTAIQNMIADYNDCSERTR